MHSAYARSLLLRRAHRLYCARLYAGNAPTFVQQQAVQAHIQTIQRQRETIRKVSGISNSQASVARKGGELCRSIRVHYNLSLGGLQ